MAALASAVVVATAMLALAASAAAAGSKTDGIRVPSRAADEVARFWTGERIRRARPVGFAAERRATPARARARAGAGADFDPVEDSTAPAARVHGVVLFQFLFGAARCSGTAIDSPNGAVVLTAGHCVHFGGPINIWFSQKWAFVPGYRHGQRPFGVFPAKWLGATREWLRTGSTNSDVGIAAVGRNERGETLKQAVGGAGIAWNLDPDQRFDVHGYPAEKPFDGRTQRLCADRTYLGHDPLSFVVAGPLNLGVHCQVTEGGSGGSWTIRDGVVNGVSSYGYPDDAATIFSPYFGREVGRLYRRAVKVR